MKRKKKARRYLWVIERWHEGGWGWRFWHADETREQATINKVNTTNVPKSHLRLLKYVYTGTR